MLISMNEFLLAITFHVLRVHFTWIFPEDYFYNQYESYSNSAWYRFIWGYLWRLQVEIHSSHIQHYISWNQLVDNKLVITLSFFFQQYHHVDLIIGCLWWLQWDLIFTSFHCFPWQQGSLRCPETIKKLVHSRLFVHSNLCPKYFFLVCAGLEGDFFTKKFTDDPFAQLAMFHYPPHPASRDGHEVWGVGRHTDYGALTILLQDDVGGLQVETRDGSWIDVPPIPGSFVINLGDMMEIWTRGALKAGPHRAKVSPSHHRLSVAMFYDPGFDCVISPIPLDKTLIPLEKTSVKLSMDFPIHYGDYILKKYCGILPEDKTENVWWLLRT